MMGNSKGISSADLWGEQEGRNGNSNGGDKMENFKEMISNAGTHLSKAKESAGSYFSKLKNGLGY